MGLFNGLYNLFKGLTITGKHLGRHAITVQYPEQRDVIPERSRGVVVLLSDKEDGTLNCTACELCMRACPVAAIRVESHRDPETKRKVLDRFTVEKGLCCYCGMCEEACNFSAIKLATKYEFSTTDKEELFWETQKLQDVGRDVPYEDTRRKKKAAAKKTDDKKTDGKKAAAADKPGPKDESGAADKTEPKAEPKAEEKEEPKSEAAPAGKPEAPEEPGTDQPQESASMETAGEDVKKKPEEPSDSGGDEGKTA
jgi:NADH-quinone oxidoreductase subunit I